jgi:hypothetical protein
VISDEELWALDTGSKAAIHLADVRNAARFGVSRDGGWVAWAAHPPNRDCVTEAYVAPTEGAAAPRRIALPPTYRLSWITGIAAGPGGRVTIRVAACGDNVAESTDERAILTADPGATQFRVLVQGRPTDAEHWPISQDGRVFGACQLTKRAGRPFAKLTVVESEPALRVRVAVLAYGQIRRPDLPGCVVSDSGLGTMTIFQAKGPGKQPHDHWQKFYRGAGITIGDAGTKRFRLPWGLMIPGFDVLAATPNGDTVLLGQVGLNVQKPVVRVMHTVTSSYSRAVSASRVFPRGGAQLTATSDREPASGMPLPWDPFAASILTVYAGNVSAFDPLTLHATRPMRVAPPGPSRSNYTICFLPSKRVLIKTISTSAPNQPRWNLYMSDPSRSRFGALAVSALGSVSSISCDAVGSNKLFLAAAETGEVFEAPATGLDDSPLTVAPA